jgi:hypothetical protein
MVQGNRQDARAGKADQLKKYPQMLEIGGLMKRAKEQEGGDEDSILF